VFCTTAPFTWKLDPTDVSCMAGHANVRAALLMYVGTTAGVLDATTGKRNPAGRVPAGFRVDRAIRLPDALPFLATNG
jgi:hypothetical protein